MAQFRFSGVRLGQHLVETDLNEWQCDFFSCSEGIESDWATGHLSYWPSSTSKRIFLLKRIKSLFIRSDWSTFWVDPQEQHHADRFLYKLVPKKWRVCQCSQSCHQSHKATWIWAFRRCLCKEALWLDRLTSDQFNLNDLNDTIVETLPKKITSNIDMFSILLGLESFTRISALGVSIKGLDLLKVDNFTLVSFMDDCAGDEDHSFDLWFARW